ncbi:fatty acyl-AMP ligase [Paenibacillus sp. SYP-B4298]|uniref:fatty acyl-AMP ligase n=1 Tax=Paenibacillus sp. SYP-B4298 TaxID=2996034 RepID=UPI0022DE4ABB|nr:fatty acyl-AMP ligase [Paenibacillus sp. SYP-B4298]
MLHMNEQGTIVDILLGIAQARPEDLAITHLDTVNESISYGMLLGRARAIATVLLETGASGHRVMLAYPSSIEYVCAFFGCLLAGAIAVPVYPPKHSKQDVRFESIQQDSGSAFALTSEAILTDLLNRNSQYVRQDGLRWIVTDTLEAEDHRDGSHRLPTADEVCFLQYTSGSTSMPKGVMVSHGNIVTNTKMIASTFDMPPSGTIVSWLPHFHDMGLIGKTLLAVSLGYHLVQMPPIYFMQRPVRWLQAISTYKAVLTAAPNFAFDLCVKKVTAEQMEGLDLSDLKNAVCGAEPIRFNTVTAFSEKFSTIGFRQEAFCPSFGLAEATLMVSGSDPYSSPNIHTLDKGELKNHRVVFADTASYAQPSCTTHVVSCGKPNATTTVAIVDPQTGMLCPNDRIGEVWLAGPNITLGYWNRSEETASVFHRSLPEFPNKLFMRTGDLGYMHDGELAITGRLKDCFSIRGQNYFPNDIEHTVESSHLAIQQGATAAFAVEHGGEERLAVIAEIDRQWRKSDLALVATAVRTAIFEEHGLQVHALILSHPGSVPKTTSGKIQRRQCKQLYEEQGLPALYAQVRNQHVPDWGAVSHTRDEQTLEQGVQNR